MLQHGAGKYPVHADVEKHVYAKGKGLSEPGKVGEVLYNRGLVNAMLGVEAIRKAQEKFGKKPLTGEEVRWGFENLDLSAARLKELGFEGMMRPMKISCADHEGARDGRVQQWDGKALEGDLRLVHREPGSHSSRSSRTCRRSTRAEKKIEPRDCSKAS